MAEGSAPDNAGVRFFPPGIFLGGLAIGYILDLIRHWPIAPPDWVWPVRIVGLAAVVLGFVVMLSATALFQRVGTHIEPWKPSTRLALEGPYRFTRNPMYLGLALILGGGGLIGNSWWPLIALAPAILIIRTQAIAREERYLEAKFGDEYRTFKARVRRWF